MLISTNDCSLVVNTRCYDLPPIRALDFEIQIGVVYRISADLENAVTELAKQAVLQNVENFFMGSELKACPIPQEVYPPLKIYCAEEAFADLPHSTHFLVGCAVEYFLEDEDISHLFSFANTNSELEDFIEFCEKPVILEFPNQTAEEFVTIMAELHHFFGNNINNKNDY
jgi:hypothetical protein